MNRDVYREAFHLNDTELELIDGLVPPGQMLIRKEQTSKKVHLNVDSLSHWMATNNACDNLKSRNISTATVLRMGFAIWRKSMHSGRVGWPYQPPTATCKETRYATAEIHRRCRFGCFCHRCSGAGVPHGAYHSQDIVPIRAKLKYTTLIRITHYREDHGSRHGR